MPSKNPNNHSTRFKPGNPGGPGRNKNWLKPSELKDYMAKYSRMTVQELWKQKEAPTATVIEVILAGVLLRIVEDPDPSKLEYVLNRTVGRVVEVMEDEAEGQNAITMKRPDGTIVRIGPNGIEPVTPPATSAD